VVQCRFVFGGKTNAFPMEGLLQIEIKVVLTKKWKKHYVKLTPTEILIYKGETASGDVHQRIEINKGAFSEPLASVDDAFIIIRLLSKKKNNL